MFSNVLDVSKVRPLVISLPHRLLHAIEQTAREKASQMATRSNPCCRFAPMCTLVHRGTACQRVSPQSHPDMWR
jgi:hypothetical protein